MSKIDIHGETVPILPLRGLVMFPDMVLQFEVGRKSSVKAIENALKNNQKILIVAQKNVEKNEPKAEDIYKIGTLSLIKQVVRSSSDVVSVFVEGIQRAIIKDFEDDKTYLKGTIELCEKSKRKINLKNTALMRKVKDTFLEYLSLFTKTPVDLVPKMLSYNELEELADFVSSNIILNFADKQRLLEELDPQKRLEKLLVILCQEIKVIGIENKLALKLKKKIDKTQKEYILREQMRVISEELGENDDCECEISDAYKKKIKKLGLNKNISEKLLKECDRLAKTMPGSSDSNVMETYLDVCLELPWNNFSKENFDLKKSEKILEKEHFGLKKVKERVLEILAVKQLNKNLKSQIICLVGPPGVGKTSIAKSVAKALGRKYVRVSLGGVQDESEIRGHRRTYVAAMPGRIISAIKQAKTMNPVILLDEIDKLSKDYRGDPSSALLEVLDAEQNHEFHDRYLDLPFDLSNVLFIATANDKHEIPKPLYDRMEMINLYSYTHDEKFNIAKKYLIPKQIKRNGLTSKKFKITDKAINELIDGYTKEAGVRELERKIASLMRKSAKIILNSDNKIIKINENKLSEMLGPRKFKKDSVNKSSEVGIVRGLAWTSVGGETMPIEVALMKGKGKVQITGSLGNVMKESAQIAVSYIRSNSDKLGINKDFYNKLDIHIHAPEGATPKDGPSAGITMTTAIVSALSEIPVKQDVAMTGEVTLKGKVLPIGGLKEKAMAAFRAGIKTVIIPLENESDLFEVDEVVKNKINFVFADNLDIVLNHALDKHNQPNLLNKNVH